MHSVLDEKRHCLAAAIILSLSGKPKLPEQDACETSFKKSLI
jgi:hypothetical protein